MSQPSPVIPKIEATAAVPVIVPPLPEQQTSPLRAPPDVVDGEIVAAADNYQPPSAPRGGRWRMRALFGAVALLSLALGATFSLVVSPLLFATATITLTPEARTLSAAVSIPLPVRLFPSDPESLSRTVAATGTATRPATVARGSITFYNALPAPQTVPAGTLVTSASGIPVLTEEDAYIPAASPPTEGAATVRAQAESTGSAGNIAAGTIGGPCCRAYVLAYNGAFWGGADARTYRTPTPGDIATAQAPLRSQVDRRMQAAIHTWLRPREVLLPPQCHATASSSAQPGAEVDHVTVTVGETCTAAAYNESARQQTATTRLTMLASRQFGPAYRLVSAVRTTLIGTTTSGDHVTLRLQLSGVYAYSFSGRELTQLRTQLAGVSREHASVMLMQLPGVAHTRIESSYATLPRDPGRIHILLSQ